jgi:hypothetical protein
VEREAWPRRLGHITHGSPSCESRGFSWLVSLRNWVARDSLLDNDWVKTERCNEAGVGAWHSSSFWFKIVDNKKVKDLIPNRR